MDFSLTIKLIQQEYPPKATLFDHEHSDIIIDEDIVGILETSLRNYLKDFGEVTRCDYNYTYDEFMVSIRVYGGVSDIVYESNEPSRPLPPTVLACMGLSRQTPVFTVYFSEVTNTYSSIKTDPESIFYEFTFFPPNLVSIGPSITSQMLFTDDDTTDWYTVEPHVESLYFNGSFGKRSIHFIGDYLEDCDCDAVHIDVSAASHITELVMTVKLYDKKIKGIERLQSLEILRFDDSTYVYPTSAEIMSLRHLSHLWIGYLFCDTLDFNHPVNVRFCGVTMCNPNGKYQMLLNLYTDYPSRFFTTEPQSICVSLEISDFNKVVNQNLAVPLSRVEIDNPSILDAIRNWVRYIKETRKDLSTPFVLDILRELGRHLDIDMDRFIDTYLEESYKKNIEALKGTSKQSHSRIIDFPGFYNEHDGLLSYVYSRSRT